MLVGNARRDDRVSGVGGDYLRSNQLGVGRERPGQNSRRAPPPKGRMIFATVQALEGEDNGGLEYKAGDLRWAETG